VLVKEDDPLALLPGSSSMMPESPGSAAGSSWAAGMAASDSLQRLATAPSGRYTPPSGSAANLSALVPAGGGSSSSAALAGPGGGGGHVSEALLERLRAALRAKMGEAVALEGRLRELEATRDSLANELLAATQAAEQVRGARGGGGGGAGAWDVEWGRREARSAGLLACAGLWCCPGVRRVFKAWWAWWGRGGSNARTALRGS
jgi:hypothetical protein